jgi:hypothetical protein
LGRWRDAIGAWRVSGLCMLWRVSRILKCTNRCPTAVEDAPHVSCILRLGWPCETLDSEADQRCPYIVQRCRGKISSSKCQHQFSDGRLTARCGQKCVDVMKLTRPCSALGQSGHRKQFCTVGPAEECRARQSDCASGVRPRNVNCSDASSKEQGCFMLACR